MKWALKGLAILVLLFVFTFALPGCAGSDRSAKDFDDKTDGSDSEESELPDGTQHEFFDLAYGNHKRQKLDIFLPAPPGELQDNVPFFLLIHGGSWTGGDKSDFYYLTSILNQYGYAAVTINYRLLVDGAIWTDMLDDIAAAVSFLHQNADGYGLRADKFGLWGNSAGGHLALLYGYRMRFASALPIAMIVSQVGPTDFTDPAYFDTDSDTLSQRLNLLSALIGEELTADDAANGRFPQAVYDASPLSYPADATYPPTLLAYGGKDTLVPYSNATLLYNKLNSLAPARVRLIGFPNSGHDLGDERDKAKLDAFLLTAKETAAYYLPV